MHAEVSSLGRGSALMTSGVLPQPHAMADSDPPGAPPRRAGCRNTEYSIQYAKSRAVSIMLQASQSTRAPIQISRFVPAQR
jgi:hypothetical protein